MMEKIILQTLYIIDNNITNETMIYSSFNTNTMWIEYIRLHWNNLVYWYGFYLLSLY